MSGFSKRQLAKLCQEVDTNFVQKRRVGEKELSYLPGWFVISQANAIFGHGGWDRQTLQLERLFERTKMDIVSCAYLAKVRVTVRAGDKDIVREGTGVGQTNSSNSGEAHERAIKGAETDATKRALATFGSRFGLSLYRSAADTSNFVLIGPKGEPVVKPLSPAAFAGGLRQMIFLSRNDLELAQLLEANRASLEALRSFSGLRAASGRHYADILYSLAEKRRQSFREPIQRQEPVLEASSPGPVLRVAQTAIEGTSGISDMSEASAEIPTQAATQGQFSVVPVGAKTQIHAGIVQEPAKTQACAMGGGEPALPPLTPPEDCAAPLPPTTHPARVPHQVTKGGADPLSTQLGDRSTTEAINPSDVRTGATGGTAIQPKTPIQFSSLSIPARSRLGWQIDKSVLNYSSERRIRNKQHIQFVASQPCLICEQAPCHAHHITFAQPRGLSLKVSDEFTVPLCVIHHNAIHQHAPEKAWWANVDINPLQAAAYLWQQTLQRLIDQAEHKNGTSAL